MGSTLRYANRDSFIRSATAFFDLEGIRFPAATHRHRSMAFNTSPDGTSIDGWTPYWIMGDEGKPVAGTRIKGTGEACHLHFMPWTTDSEKREVLYGLSKEVHAFHGLSPVQGDLLIGLGFSLEHQRTAMIFDYGIHRDVSSEATDYHLAKEKPSLDELVRLHFSGFKGGVDALWFELRNGRQPDDDIYESELKTWFEAEAIGPYGASIHCRDRSGTLVGTCLVGEEDGLPTIFSIVVDPVHRCRGLAKAMLETVLSKEIQKEIEGEPTDIICQLYVTTGNPAIGLYESLGFKKMIPFGLYISG